MNSLIKSPNISLTVIIVIKTFVKGNILEKKLLYNQQNP